jgi:hypothetical protein
MDAGTSGRLTGIAVDNFASGNSFFSPNHVGVRLLNKNDAVHEIAFVRGFTKGVQCQAYGGVSCAYNEITLGVIYVCATAVELNCATADSGFPSENKFNGGDVQGTSSFNNYGSCFGVVFSRDYETGGYSGHSGNFWYKPCFQLGAPGLTWSPGASLTAGFRYFSPAIGGEWLCATGGVSGTVEPTVIPSVVDMPNVTLTAGSAVAVMADTTGLSAGMHLRGSNPADAFPLNTYIASVDSTTNVTLTQPASRASTNYHAVLVSPTVDNAATLVYLGPYRRSPVWLRPCSIANGIADGRWESGTGEAIIVSGSHLFPQAFPPDFFLPSEFTATFHSQTSSAITINNCNFPTWTHASYDAGDAVRPRVLASQYWECTVAGTTGASEPTPPAGAAGITFTDGSATWITRNIPDTGACGDWGEYCGRAGGGGDSWDISVGRPFDSVTSTAKLDSLHLRAIGSETGWRVRGAVKCGTSGVMATNFAPSDLSLARDAVLINMTNAALGAVVKTNLLKCFSVRKYFVPSTYGYSRVWLVPLDATYNLLPAPPSAQAYHRRIQSWCYANSSGFYQESDDGPVIEFVALCNAEVENVFVGIQLGSTGTPVACGLAGIEIAERAHRSSDTPQTHSVQLSTLHGNDQGARMSLGLPTSGFFLAAGEFVQNASVTPGASPKGWFVTTAGVLAPAWASGTPYVNGQLVTVTAAGKVYAANGAFTSGTAPTGTGTNIVDATATAIVSGDVATWDYLAPVAVLVADNDTDALFQAGSTGTTPTPNCQNGLTQVWTMNNNISVGVPTNPPQIGQTLTLVFVQDATGGRTIVWNAAYRNAPPWSAGLAGQRATADFKYDGISWQFVGGSTAFG